MKSVTDVASGVVLLGLCALGAYSVGMLPEEGGLDQIGPGAFPRMILICLAVLSCVLLVQGFLRAPLKRYWPEAKTFRKILLFIGLFYFYLLTLVELGDFFAGMDNPPFEANGGFSVSTFLFLLIALPLLGRRRPVEILSVAVLTTAILVFVFSWFFQVLLP